MGDDTNLTSQSDEIEALSAIYDEDFNVESEAARKYVVNVKKDVRLMFRLTEEYPSDGPPYYQLDALQLTGEDRIIISNRLNELYTENLGLPIIYIWVEAIREYVSTITPPSTDAAAAETQSFPLSMQKLVENHQDCPDIFSDETITDRKSVFQAHVAHVTDIHQVRAVTRKLLSNKKIAAATHNIQAFRIKLSNGSIAEDCDDDGENQAGGRLLHLVNIIGAVDVVVVVSRWYGGIQLGPDRFKHINNCARTILEKQGFISKAQVLYDFDAQAPEELQLVADEIITIVNDDVGGGWWEARNEHGQSGLIPKDYVELIAADSYPEPSMPPPSLPAPSLPPQNDPWAHQNGQQSAWDQPPAVQSSWENQTYQQNQHTAGHGAPAASAPAADDDDWDEDDWSDDDGSSATTEQSNMGDVQRRPNAVRNRDTSSSVRSKTASRLSTHNKLGFDMQLLSKEAQNVPESEKIRIVETHRGWEWEGNSDPFSCLLDSPKKSSKLKGLKSFIVYQLTPSFSGIAVQRRYKHFDWLLGRFQEKYPTIVIPPLPDKQISGRYEDDFINERMKQLQEWVTRITNHPVVSKAQVWRHFLTCTDEKGWKRGKRDAENDRFKGGKFFHTIVVPPVPLDLIKVEKDIENFAGFIKKMDDGVRVLSTAACDQIKRYNFNFKKEYLKVSEGMGELKKSFDGDGCSDSQQLNEAIAETGRAYSDIATMWQQQPRQDWGPLADQLHVYKGILSGFDGTLGAQKVASAKVRGAQEEGKMTETDVQAFISHADAISYSLYAEISHFQANRQQEFKLMMQNLLTEQIDFYKRITQRLEEAKRSYDSF